MSRIIVGKQLKCGCITYAVTIESVTGADLRDMQQQGLVLDIVEGKVALQSCQHCIVCKKEVYP